MQLSLVAPSLSLLSIETVFFHKVQISIVFFTQNTEFLFCSLRKIQNCFILFRKVQFRKVQENNPIFTHYTRKFIPQSTKTYSNIPQSTVIIFPQNTELNKIIPQYTDSVPNSAKYRIPQSTISR